jgi:IS30 family transposase
MAKRSLSSGLKQAGLDQSQIAFNLGVNKSTISREVSRYKGQRGWRPEQVALRLALEGGLQISHETVHRHIYADKKNRGDLHQH